MTSTTLQVWDIRHLVADCEEAIEELNEWPTDHPYKFAWLLAYEGRLASLKKMLKYRGEIVAV